MLKVWNVSLVLATGILGDPRHVPRALGDPRLDPRVRRARTLGVPFAVLIVAMIAGSIVPRRRARRDALRSEHRLDSLLSREAMFLLNNLVLVGARLRRLLGHVLPADLRGADRRRSARRPAVVRPLHRAAGARARAAVRHRAGDRVAARDAGAPAAQPARCRWSPAARRARAARCSAGAASSPPSLADVRARRVRDRRRRPGVLARHARAPGDDAASAPPAALVVARAPQPPALRRLPRARRDRGAVRRRRRVVGVPARARRPPDARADRATSAATTFTYVQARPARIAAARPASSSGSTLGSRLRVSKDGEHVALLRPEARLLPGARADRSGASARYFEGEATSEVGLQRRRAARRLDRRCSRTSAALQPTIKKGDARVRQRGGELDRRRRRSHFLGRRWAGSSRATRQRRRRRSSGSIVSPLVTWIWLGALIVVFGGGLIAAVAGARRARAAAPRARYAARVAQDLGARVAASPALTSWSSSPRSSSSCSSAVVVRSSAAPLRARRGRARASRRRGPSAPTSRPRKDAKYREIRDAEMDHRTGKLSDEDWRALDRELRAEAVDDPARARRSWAASAGAATHPPSDGRRSSQHLCSLPVGRPDLPGAHALGKDAGLSGAFGVGTGQGSLGGGSLVERNLNRWTVGFAILWILVILLLVTKPWN